MPSTRRTNQFARNAGLFAKHVVPQALKPIHSLWHRGLAFLFLLFAITGAWKLITNPGKLAPVQFIIALIFIVVLAGYGISSLVKSRRISRS